MKNHYYSWKDLSCQDKTKAAEIIEGELVRLSPVPTALSPRIERDFSVKAVLFDVYGTLLISGTGDISLAKEKENLFSLKKALDLTGFSLSLIDADTKLTAKITEEIKASHKILKDRGIEYPEVDIITIWHRVLSSFKEELLLDGDITPGSLAILSAYNEIISNPVWEMPNAFSLLTNFKNTNIPMGIISNAQYYTPLTLELLSGKSLEELGFSLDLCAWSYKLLMGKPSAKLFEDPIKNLKKKGIKAEEVLYVGNDMLNDMYTAREWGCRTALFAGDQRSLRLREEDDRCSDLSPDLIITDLNQLKELL
jgi:putative hydrolase of the HAD superfamily